MKKLLPLWHSQKESDFLWLVEELHVSRCNYQPFNLGEHPLSPPELNLDMKGTLSTWRPEEKHFPPLESRWGRVTGRMGQRLNALVTLEGCREDSLSNFPGAPKEPMEPICSPHIAVSGRSPHSFSRITPSVCKM